MWLFVDENKVLILPRYRSKFWTQYLLDNANGLSEDTAKRRASTLKRWVNAFKLISGRKNCSKLS